MGEDKSLLPFSNTNSLTQYQYERLKPHFESIYISSKIDKFDFLDNKNELILDIDKDIYSPIIALKAIFDKIQKERIFIITVDTPLVEISSISKIIDNSINYDICVAKTEKVHNLCGVFSSSISKTIDDMIDKDIHKVSYLLKNNNSKFIEFPNDDEFINLNNQDEYKKAKNIIS